MLQNRIQSECLNASRKEKRKLKKDAAAAEGTLTSHPGGNPGANLKSISHRCHPILVAFVWALT